jgi:hypothetical protein
MSLQVWLPLNGDLHNQGLTDYTLTMFRGTETYNDNGKLGKCFYANGVNTIKINNIIPDFYIFTGYSLSAWFYIEAQNTTHSGSAIISAGNWNNQVLNLAVSDWSSDHYTNLRVSGTSWSKIYNYTFNKNTWYQVVVCSDGVHTYAYVNGALIGDTVEGFLPTSIEGNDICIGGATYYSGMQFFGRICDVRIYDHCLSAKEVKELSKGLVAHYKLDGSGSGCENLYTGTRTFSGSWGNSGGWTTDTTQTFNGFTVKQRSSVWGGLYQNVTATQGDIFTISFYAKVETGGTVLSVHRSNLGNVTTGLSILGGNFVSGESWFTTTNNDGSWRYCWATVQITGSDITYLQWRIENSIADKTMWITRFKLERGNKATPWVPNSADPEYSITGYNDTTIYDSSGYNYHGKINTAQTLSSDTPRYSVSTNFNGTDNAIKIPFNAMLGLTAAGKTDYTISVWTYKTAIGSKGYQTILGGPSGFELEARNAAETNPVYVAWNWGKNTGTYEFNKWCLFTFVHTTTDNKIYVNGELASSGSAANVPIGDFFIGSWRDVSSQNYQGSMSDFRIYATALSADDIKELYQTSASIDKAGNMYAYELREI